MQNYINIREFRVKQRIDGLNYFYDIIKTVKQPHLLQVLNYYIDYIIIILACFRRFM